MYEQKYEALEATRDKDVKTIREELTAAIAKLDLAEQRYESVTAAQTIMAHESLLAKQRDSLKLELALKSRDAAEEKCVALIMDSKNYVRSIIQYESLLAKNNELSNQLQPTLKYRDISSNKYATFSDNHQNDIIETIMHPEIRSESLSAAKQNQLSVIAQIKLTKKAIYDENQKTRENLFSQLESIDLKLSEIISQQMNKLEKIPVSSENYSGTTIQQKEAIFEKVFEKKLEQYFGSCYGFSLRHTALNGLGHEMDYETELEGHSILWELKNYSSTVPTKEVEKFNRDLREHSNVTVGIFVSRKTKICGKTATGSLQTEFHYGKMQIYKGEFENFCGQDEWRVFQMLLAFCRIWWSMCGGVPENRDFDSHECQRKVFCMSVCTEGGDVKMKILVNILSIQLNLPKREIKIRVILIIKASALLKIGGSKRIKGISIAEHFIQ